MVKRYFSGEVSAVKPLQSAIVEAAVFNTKVRFNEGNSVSGVVYWIADQLFQELDPITIEVDEEKAA
jgi:hypothetical protein